MSDKNAVTSSGGSGLLIGGIVLAIAIAAGGYMMVQQDASPTEAELSSVVPQDASVPAAQSTSTQAPVVQAPSSEAEPDQTPDVAALDPEKQPLEESEAVLEGASQGDDVAPQEFAPEGTATDTAEAETGAEAPVQEDTAYAPAAPSIDEVRLDADGVAVIAGRAEPGATVEVVVDGDVIATAQADAGGAFAAIGFLPPQDRARALSLRAGQDGEMLASEGEVILAPVPAAPTVIAEAQVPAASADTDIVAETVQKVQSEPAKTDAAGTPEPRTESVAIVEAPAATETTEAAQTLETAAANTSVDTVGENTPSADVAETDPVTEKEVAEAPAVAKVEVADPAPAVQATAPAETEPAEPTTEAAPQVALLKSDAEGVTLLQTAPEPPAQIQLDTIGYSDSGAVQLAGRASSEAVEIRVYLNNRAAATLPVADTGSWRGEVPDVAAGVYTLRVDEVDAGGAVTSRIETPFKREAPAVLAAVAAEAEGPATAVTVQTGDTLWAIARDRYGEGLLYVQVFEANRNAIRNPDLIYPGQIFELPPD